MFVAGDKRQPEVLGNLPKLAIRQFGAIVVRKRDRCVADPENYVRAALTQLLETSLESEPDLASLWHFGHHTFRRHFAVIAPAGPDR